MDRRLVRCGWVAAALHGSLLALGTLRPERATPQTKTAEVIVDVVELHSQLEPRPIEAPSKPEAFVLPRLSAARRQVLASRAPELRGRVEPEATTETGEMPGPAAASDGPALARTKHLSLGDLGVTGASSAVVAALGEEAPTVARDVAGLRSALRNRDTELGLGPGGAVAETIRPSADEFAPLDSEATLSVDLSRTGSIEAISLDNVTSHDYEWLRVIRDVRQRVADRFIAAGGPLRVTLLVTSRSALRSGPTKGSLAFDVSNIGSTTMHWLHIRVLRQTAL